MPNLTEITARFFRFLRSTLDIAPDQPAPSPGLPPPHGKRQRAPVPSLTAAMTV